MRKRNDICPVELHGHLDSGFRKLLHNPRKILKPFVGEGDTAIDIGPGPGFFTIPMAELAGSTGTVIAADLQQGMLDIIGKKIENTPLEGIIRLHRTQRDSLNLFVKADFILLFYMVHEVPDQLNFFLQVRDTLKPGGKVLMIEPPVHVTKKDFERTKGYAAKAGLSVHKGPGLFLDRSAVLTLSAP